MSVRISRVLALQALAAMCGHVMGATLQIDHVTIAGAHLDALRKAFTEVSGLPTEYGGPHSNHATEMALTSFPDGSYLELMGIQANADPVAVSMHEWSKFLQNNGGPCAFAIHVPDIMAEVVQLKAAGIAAGKPESSGRTRPDGTKLAWQTLDVGPGHRGSLFPFLITDQTPRELRVYPSGKPSTDRASGVSKVVIGVKNLQDAIGQYRRAFGLAAPHRESNAELQAAVAWFEGTPIVLAQGIDDNSPLNRRVREYGEAPVAFVLRGHGPHANHSHWFKHSILWMRESQLGWKLGIETGD
jgi:hypothetical protein